MYYSKYNNMRMRRPKSALYYSKYNNYMINFHSTCLQSDGYVLKGSIILFYSEKHLNSSSIYSYLFQSSLTSFSLIYAYNLLKPRAAYSYLFKIYSYFFQPTLNFFQLLPLSGYF